MSKNKHSPYHFLRPEILDLLTSGNLSAQDPFASAAREEAHQTAERIDAVSHFPVEPSKRWLYAVGTWLTVAILVLSVPKKDLLGFLKRQKDREEQARKLELAQKDIEQTTGNVKLAVKQLGDAELAAEMAALSEMPEGIQPELAKRQAIRKLGDLADKVKKAQSGAEPGSIEMLREMLKQLKGSQDSFSQQLRTAMAKGDFAGASDLLQKLQQQLNRFFDLLGAEKIHQLIGVVIGRTGEQ